MIHILILGARLSLKKHQLLQGMKLGLAWRSLGVLTQSLVLISCKETKKFLKGTEEYKRKYKLHTECNST